MPKAPAAAASAPGSTLSASVAASPCHRAVAMRSAGRITTSASAGARA